MVLESYIGPTCLWMLRTGSEAEKRCVGVRRGLELGHGDSLKQVQTCGSCTAACKADKLHVCSLHKSLLLMLTLEPWSLGTSEAYLQRISPLAFSSEGRGIIMAEYSLAPYSPD